MNNKVGLVLDDLKKWCEFAKCHGTEDAALDLALEWATAANAEIERLRAALNFIATHQDSEWPERCRLNVETASAALEKP